MIVVLVVCFLSLCFRRLKDSGTKETKETSASNPGIEEQSWWSMRA